MKRKHFWLSIVFIAILCIVIPTASGAYRSLSKKSGVQKAVKTADERKKETAPQQGFSWPVESQEETLQQPAGERYIVQKGDNLWVIAQKYKTSVAAIRDLNKLTGDLLQPGQELLIPAPETQLRTNKNQETMPSRSLDSSGRYIIQEGDNLWLIAENFRISVDILKQLNNLNSDRVLPGDTLLVSGAVVSSNQYGNPAATSEQQQTHPAAPQPATDPEPAPDPEPTTDPEPAPDPEPEQTPAPQPKSSIVETAKQYIGVPYAYGGSSPKGFDCSGFVQYVFRQHGISLPRTASEQASVGTKVSTPEPGDLVFFTRNVGGGGIEHVGIYVGDDSFIHANINLGVIITPLSSQWYSARYAGARRI